MKRLIDTQELALVANTIRQDIIQMLVTAGSGHSAGSLGMADVFTALYFNILNHKPEDPLWEDRDRVVLSNAHICPVLYATLANVGYFPKEELNTLRKINSRLQGHSNNHGLQGVETSGGPLGQGLSQAVGFALADRMDNKKRWTYCLVSDGEMDEGQTWEAGMLASKEKLFRLIAIMDRNNIQIDGPTESVMPLEPLVDKWKAWGWHVQEIDGHNFNEIIAACGQAKTVENRPSMIIA
ncbi:MAG: transketolase, partial [bacterium]